MQRPIDKLGVSVSLLRVSQHPGYTLVELLAIMVIIGILAALFFPILGTLQNAANQSKCVSRMRVLGNAIMLYGNDYSNRLPGFGINTRSRWVHQTAPYLGYASDAVYQGVPVSLEAYTFKEFTCPAASSWADPSGPTFIGLYGINPNLIGAAGDIHGVRRSNIPRPSATVLLADKVSSDPLVRISNPYPEIPAGSAANHWSDRRPTNGPSGRSHLLYVDGHVGTVENWIGTTGFEVKGQ